MKLKVGKSGMVSRLHFLFCFVSFYLLALTYFCRDQQLAGSPFNQAWGLKQILRVEHLLARGDTFVASIWDVKMLNIC